jgi:hypothetical protein
MIKLEDLKPIGYLVVGEPYKTDSEWVEIQKMPSFNPGMPTLITPKWWVVKGTEQYQQAWYEYLSIDGEWLENSNEPQKITFPSLEAALNAYNKSITPSLPQDTDVIDLHKIE